MRITLRRLLVIPIVAVFALLFVLALVTTRINATVFQSEFYTKSFDELAAYSFASDTVLPEILEDGGSSTVEIGFGISLSHDEVVSYFKRVLPPDWVRQTVEQLVEELVPYASGETDEFTIAIHLADRAQAALPIVAEIILAEEVYDYLLNERIKPALSNTIVTADLPYGVTLTSDQIIEGIAEVLSREWLQQSLEQGLHEFTKYAVGIEENFTILIPLQDRVPIALMVLEEWLLADMDNETYEYLLEEQIAPAITSHLGERVELPFGINVTDDEIVSATGSVLPVSWVRDRTRDALRAVGPYLFGQSDNFTVDIPLQDRFQAAVETLVLTVDAKFETLLDSLPVCSPSQLGSISLSLGKTPECLPPGATYELVREIVGLDIRDQIETLIVKQLPDTISFSDENLVELVGADVPLDRSRIVFRDGITFTDEDLRRLIVEQGGVGDLDRFDEVRRYLKNGLTLSEKDFETRAGVATFSQIDSMRRDINLYRSGLPVLIIALICIGVMAGFLGGRNWWSRLGWSGFPLAVSGGTVAAGLIFPGKPLIKSVIENGVRTAELSESLMEKTMQLINKLVDIVADPLVFQGGCVFVLGGAMILIGLYGSFRLRRISEP